MNSRGFTLVEILVVIVILGVLLTMVSTNVFGILDDSKTKLGNYTQSQIEDAAKLYVIDLDFDPTEENTVILQGKDQIINQLGPYYPQMESKCEFNSNSKITIISYEVATDDYTGGDVKVEVNDITCRK